MTELSLLYTRPSPDKDSTLRRFTRHFDWVLFLAVLFLTCLGMVMVYSASLRFGHPGIYLGKQLLALVIGMTALFVFATVNYQIFSQYYLTVLGVSLFLLLVVLVAGKTYHGTKAWFVLGPLSFQPTEICKLFTILVLAGWCERHLKEMHHLRSLTVPFLIALAHVALILLQPDFGSTLVYFPILLGILFVAGARTLHLFGIFVFGVLLGAVMIVHTLLSLSPIFLEAHPVLKFIYRSMSFGKEMVLQLLVSVLFAVAWWLQKELRLRIPGLYFVIAFLLVASSWAASALVVPSMKEYQKKRLIVFFKPEVDPTGAGYHVIQSVIALGSGRVLGKGLFEGTQSRLGFLPEQHTDFIFSVIGEELGFLISGFVLLLYLLLIWRAIAIAGNSRDRFGSLVAVGIGTMFGFYAILNLGMVMGMAPVTGLPLPFLSYGGSSLISSLAATGILLSIHARRYTY